MTQIRKTNLWLFYQLFLWVKVHCQEKYDYKGYDKNAPWEERFHDPNRFSPPPPLPKTIGDTDYTVPPEMFTPDYRLPEPPRLPKYPPQRVYYEYNRPYRLSPSYIFYQWQQFFWSAGKYDYEVNPSLMCCYCSTVFKTTNVLATCAVLTTRHILTTASSTEMVLKLYPKMKSVERLLGAFYQSNEPEGNTSYYMTPARIHYHPQYLGIDSVNLSHPLPIHDLALWASTFPFFGTALQLSQRGLMTCICNRADAHKWETTSGTPKPGDEFWVIGYQWIRAYKRLPKPWFKYGLRTKDIVVPCPKLEWGWHFCLGGRWAPMGVESGTILHRFATKSSYIYSGLLGMAGFSMKLRSQRLTHYFQVINSHQNLEFMYNAYMGKLKPVFLDHRFYDTMNKAPRVKPWFYVEWAYPKPYNPPGFPFYYGGYYNIY